VYQPSEGLQVGTLAVMARRLLLTLVLFGALPAWAGAATIVGKARGETIVGTRGADLIDVVGGGRDSVRCGRGVDTVVADRGDVVAADCDVVSRRIAVDTSAGPGTHRTIVEVDAAAERSTVVAAFQVGRRTDGADAIGFATSHDAGVTWTNGLLPLSAASRPAGPWDVVSDPTVAYDPLHRRWVAVALALTDTAEAIVASTSAEGTAWSAPIPVVQDARASEQDVPLDKEWIACGSAGRCTVVATVDPDTPAAHLTVWSSADGGVTWAQGGSLPGGYYAQDVFRPDGSLGVFFFDQTRHQLAFATSTDGGATFATPVAVAPPVPTFGTKDLRAPNLPSLTQTAAGDLLAVWTGCRQVSCTRTAVMLTRSSDGGATWSAPTEVPLGPGVHITPSIAVDPGSGRLAVTTYVNTTQSCCSLVAQIATSREGGASWTVRRASVRPFARSWLAPAHGGAFLGDYVGTTFAGGRAVSVLPLAEPPQAGRLREDLFAVRS
jgi:hypothetical protein